MEVSKIDTGEGNLLQLLPSIKDNIIRKKRRKRNEQIKTKIPNKA